MLIPSTLNRIYTDFGRPVKRVWERI